ncbi:hypothetical protein TanjilG_22106 [Lupinus angustifolius]|uniref:Uncharacterized protein n=1 Tax=Lupinus angustifolius TaxID=3871 RepID=A0A4P1QTW9_LUPAN|nr:PREDICTED: uncharacterized protein LOC109331369 [Lupinus angustifolius]OIV94909.1 hypothetical protein TanjilG_22106 [Lupinus angustifolius]
MNKGGPRNFPREEGIQTRPSTNVKSMMRFNHLKQLALWATTEAPIPSLGAFYCHQVANMGEAMGLPNDPSFLTCQRCETALHPGLNSTVRIEKDRSKVKRKHNNYGNNNTQNNVVFKCHFCLHQNLMRGTPIGYLKGLYPSKPKSKRKSFSNSKLSTKPIKHMAFIHGSPVTPSSTGTPTLLGGKKRKRNNSASNKKTSETASMSAKVDGEKTLGISSKRQKILE